MNARPPLPIEAIQALRDLEGQILELALMAEIAKVFIAESSVPKDLTQDQKREADCSAFLVLRIASMAEDLNQAYQDAFAAKAARGAEA